MAATHDRIVGAKGIFKKATDSIKKAKQSGFNVCTNTTIFKETDPKEIEELFAFLTKIGIGGLLVSPGFSFEDNSNDVFIQKEEFHKNSALFMNCQKIQNHEHAPVSKVSNGCKRPDMHTMG